jgi:galactose mutarotase-like enzyme
LIREANPSTLTGLMNRLVTLTDHETRAFIYPEQGFQLHGFDVGSTQVVYGPRGAREPLDRRYGNPVLFPSVGVSNGSRLHHWDHQGQSLLMQQHGWVRDLYWHVEESDARSITGLLTPTMGMRVAFPFDFEMRLRYSVSGPSLVLDTTISNTGKEPFPYALGFHPYLRAPVGGKREACKVALPKGVRLQTADNWKSAQKSDFAARTIAANDAELPGSIVLADTGARAMEVVDEAGRTATRVSVEDSEGTYPIWVVWSAAQDAQYVCLEPWTDYPNALNRPGTRTLAAGATQKYRMTISLRSL